MIRSTVAIEGRGVAAILDGDSLRLSPGRLNAVVLRRPDGSTLRAEALPEWALTDDPAHRERQALLFPALRLADIPVGSEVHAEPDDAR